MIRVHDPKTSVSRTDSDDPDRPISLLYIVGTGRCGTTFLDVMLGQQPGFWTVGELHLLQTWLTEKKECGCNATVPECEFWQNVLKDIPTRAVAELGRLRRPPRPRGKALRWSYIFGSAASRYGAAYAAANLTILRAIRAVAERRKSGPLTLVDASKDIYRLELLRAGSGTADVRIRAIHLWRDAVGFVSHVSDRWDLDRRRKSGLRKLLLIARYALRWRVENRLFLHSMASLPPDDRLVVNFDELMADWTANAAALCRKIGNAVETEKLAHTRFDINHGISGNTPRWAELKPRQPSQPSFLNSWEQAIVRLICGSTQICLAKTSLTFG